MLSLIFKAILGLAFGAATAAILTPAFAAFLGKDDKATGPLLLIGAALCVALICTFAPTIRRAFGRGFLSVGAAFLLLPLSAFALSSRVAHDVVTTASAADQGAAAAGAGLAGIAVTGVATFFGLILGAIFIIIGAILSLGGRREVIIAQNAPAKPR